MNKREITNLSILTPSQARKPDFIGIGAARAGTSWLWERIKQSPETALPPQKELHYFDRSLDYPSSSWFAHASPLKRLFGDQIHFSRYRQFAWRRIRGAARRRDWTALRWYLRFYLGYCTDEWYLSLFDVPGSDSKLTGEISPGYAMLTTEDIRHVYNLAPEAKILFIIRNPIERAWSHTRYAWTRDRFEGIDDVDGIKEFIDSQESYGKYVQTLNRWKSVYGESKIHVSFFDDIRNDPGYLLDGLASFLNIQPKPMMVSTKSKVNASEEVSMPSTIYEYLRQKYKPEIEQLDEMFDRSLRQWLDDTALTTSSTIS